MTYAQRIAPRTRVLLRDDDANGNGGLSRRDGEKMLADLLGELAELQEELYAAGQNSLLIVLQGPDTSGKDGTIRHVLSGINPVGCRVASFKVPTELELAHDFLWRVHREVPRRGMVCVFNRSHYEDVLTARVHNLVPCAVWEARYDQINDFERLLAASGTIVVKFFLHITQDEQRERLLAREREPAKAWKLNPADWRERHQWHELMRAYEDALSRCSTDEAPWYVVSANRKWFRNLAVCQALVETLRPYRASWRAAIDRLGEVRRAELAALRATGEIER